MKILFLGWQEGLAVQVLVLMSLGTLNLKLSLMVLAAHCMEAAAH